MQIVSAPIQRLRPKPGDLVADLDTPVVLVDVARMEHNIRQWQSWMNERGVRFRPHIKTHKVPEIALMQLAAGASGIVCAKVSEAEPFAAAGVRDICIAYPVFGEQKWHRVAALAREGVRVTVNCDSEAAAEGLSRAAAMTRVTLHVQVDIDTGLHRGGVPVADITSVEQLARRIAELPGLHFEGITTFRGAGYEGAPAPLDAGHDEGRLLVEVAEKLRAAGLEVKQVAAGSTPTGRWVAEVAGVTEVRAGTYVFNDLMQLELGGASQEQLALSVLCAIVSRGNGGRVTIDGGSKTFSGDVRPSSGKKAAISKAADRLIVVERMSEEHGIGRAECDVKLGDKVRFYPYHVCPCVNLAEELVGYRGERVESVWPVAARGLRT